MKAETKTRIESRELRNGRGRHLLGFVDKKFDNVNFLSQDIKCGFTNGQKNKPNGLQQQIVSQ